MLGNSEMTEKKETDQTTGIKDAYFEMIDETVNLMKLPAESAKKILTVATEAQADLVRSFGENKIFTPWTDIFEMNSKFIETYTKQLTQSIKMSKTSLELATNGALNWENFAAEAQKNFIEGYKTWMNIFKA